MLIDTDDETFGRVRAGIHGLPGYKMTRPNTQIAATPIVGSVTTYVTQTARTTDEGFLIFIQAWAGRTPVRLIIPNKVAEAIYRQRDSLMDRSTPESRARARARREREKARKSREARKKTYAARNKTAQP